MKKLLNLSLIYFIFAMIGGVFYREFTKYMGFTGRTTLSLVHVHLLVLGTLLFMIFILFCRNTDLQNNRKFKLFLVLYNIGLPLMVIMLFVRGVIQVLEFQLSKGANAAISGIAGIAHIIITVALVILFLALKSIITKWEN
ncbi:DUF2871 domain-containing protein [Lachnoclostridium phytofermentans]|uniref:DUF2871 domain-containing protein n=1 Tax=Lachnoclostridium phytofermentans (strain ATCC 700394 / DSM 18823 / ISDg) TaxID=357809 RepID=A9KT11_LACP7|nr:DUF2871 domain-containing protein [Lachnoclostridium phytofermentans]ABX42222.1 conserved hypothetical protein [Lachnoclostridium phytofermentans ISDg]